MTLNLDHLLRELNRISMEIEGIVPFVEFAERKFGKHREAAGILGSLPFCLREVQEILLDERDQLL